MNNIFVKAALGIVGLALVLLVLPASWVRGMLAVVAYGVLPGIIWAMVVAPNWNRLEQITLGLVMGIVIGPFVLVGFARLGLTLSHGVYVAVFSLLSLAGLGLVARRQN